MVLPLSDPCFLEAAMRIWSILLLAALLASATGLAGCPGDARHPTIAMHPNASSASSPDNTHDLLARDGRAAMKVAPRESALSSYSNPGEGISFRYPRYYALEEGEVEEHSLFLKRQEDLDVQQPGARLVVTLLIPEDGFPNTTFVHGSLQLTVDDSTTAQSCTEISVSTEQATTALQRLTLHGVLFRGEEWQYLTAGTQVLERQYAGFSNGSCYEFSLVVAAEVINDPNGITKPADEARIMRQLDRIVKSVQFQERRAAPTQELNADDAVRL
jgi:hypothetical protein